MLFCLQMLGQYITPESIRALPLGSKSALPWLATLWLRPMKMAPSPPVQFSVLLLEGARERRAGQRKGFSFKFSVIFFLFLRHSCQQLADLVALTLRRMLSACQQEACSPASTGTLLTTSDP